MRFRGWGGLPQIFDETKDDWAALRRDLQSVLTDTEYASARLTTLNAHYTSPPVATAIWRLATDLGFSGGRVLEPGCGRGVFLDHLPDGVPAVVTGIELDAATALVARALHPRHEIRHEGFEATPFKESSFDLAVGNVPFGDFSLFDPRHNPDRFPIHDHFIHKSLRLLRPGGVALLITSRYTLDKRDSTARRAMAECADLIGAIRLPEGAFRGSAGTDVVTDILVLRRRLDGEAPSGPAWTDSRKVPVAGGEAAINEYFAAHPEMVLGTFALGRGMYRDGELTVLPSAETPLEAALDDASRRMAETARASGMEWAATSGATAPLAALSSTVVVPDGIKEGAFFVHGNRLYRLDGGRAEPDHGVPEAAVPQVTLMAEMRDAAREVLARQREPWEGGGIAPWQAAQQRLNRLYDTFVDRFGPVNKVTLRPLRAGADGEERSARVYPNHRHFRCDPDFAFVTALERFDEATGLARKADIFDKRVVASDAAVRTIASAKDALLACLDERGCVDLERIAALAAMPVEDAAAELRQQGLLYRTPEGGWETADAYLSGDVRVKLRDAEAAAERDPDFAANVAALTAVQPADLAPGQIDAALGAPWIPADDVRKFLRDLLDVHDVEVAYLASEAVWSVRAGRWARTGVRATAEWGTKLRDAVTLVADCLNQRLAEVWDVDDDGKRVKNAQETLAAREKQERLQEHFGRWLWQDEARAERLCRMYNDRYNNIRLRSYDGAHLTLPGANPAIQLRPHQKDAAWRVLQGGNALLAHVVGAGKTFTSIAAGMEMRRIGMVAKPLYVVPNHMLEQFSREFLQLYPAAHILAADRDALSGDGRRQFVARAATGNWDAIIMTHSGLGKIPVSPEFEAAHVRAQCDELRALLDAERAQGERLTVKELEKAVKRREERLERLLASQGKDRGVTFEEMGVDYLFIDEAHLFKNLEFATKMQGVAATGSQRASDLFMKIQYLEQRHPGRSVTFLTGTPIANSIAEMFTMQRYLQGNALRQRGVGHFDAWAAAFGRMVSQLELAPDGASYRVSTRFARFANIPELVTMFREVADVQTADMLGLPRPALAEGKAHVVAIPPSPELKTFIADLADRAEAVRNRAVDPSVDNMLKVTTDGRKAALDLRLVGIDGAAAAGKIDALADNVARVWRANREREYVSADGLPAPVRGALQLVFCDLSAPAPDRWNAYDAVRVALVARGLPRDAIRFIHDAESDAAKAQLFAECRSGKVAVLLGSTPKMGTGTNVQDRLVALHHLDAPWRPADIEQRDGRILRQGNRNAEVEIFRYVTEGSFDIYMWQTLERKASFIGQVLSGRADTRDIEDVDLPALSYAEVKAIASGDPRILEKAEVDAEVAKLSRLKAAFDESAWRLRGLRRTALADIATLEEDIRAIDRSLRQRLETRGEAFRATVGTLAFTSRKEAGEALIAAVSAEIARAVEDTKGARSVTLGQIGGFPLRAELGGRVGQGRANVVLAAPYPMTIATLSLREPGHPAGLIQSAEARLRSFEQARAQTEERIAHLRGEVAEADRRLAEPFAHADRLAQAARRKAEIEDLLRPKAADVPLAEPPSSSAVAADQPVRPLAAQPRRAAAMSC